MTQSARIDEDDSILKTQRHEDLFCRACEISVYNFSDYFHFSGFSRRNMRNMRKIRKPRLHLGNGSENMARSCPA